MLNRLSLSCLLPHPQPLPSEGRGVPNGFRLLQRKQNPCAIVSPQRGGEFLAAFVFFSESKIRAPSSPFRG